MGVRIAELPRHEDMVENFTRYFVAADAENVKVGAAWYKQAEIMAENIAAGTAYTKDQVIRLVAVISPALDWSGKNDTLPADMLNYHAAGRDLVNGSWPLRSYDSVRKAQRILDGDLDAIRGNKVTRFARNIAGDYSCATIDAWMVRAALDQPKRKYTDCGINSDGRGVYVRIEAALIEAAQAVNMPPAQVQAIIWEDVRVKNTIRKGK